MSHRISGQKDCKSKTIMKTNRALLIWSAVVAAALVVPPNGFVAFAGDKGKDKDGQERKGSDDRDGDKDKDKDKGKDRDKDDKGHDHDKKHDRDKDHDDDKDHDRKKVTICHKGHTLEVSRSAVQAHLGHGDTLGPCNITPSRNQ